MNESPLLSFLVFAVVVATLLGSVLLAEGVGTALAILLVGTGVLAVAYRSMAVRDVPGSVSWRCQGRPVIESLPLRISMAGVVRTFVRTIEIDRDRVRVRRRLVPDWEEPTANYRGVEAIPVRVGGEIHHTLVLQHPEAIKCLDLLYLRLTGREADAVAIELGGLLGLEAPEPGPVRAWSCPFCDTRQARAPRSRLCRGCSAAWHDELPGETGPGGGADAAFVPVLSAPAAICPRCGADALFRGHVAGRECWRCGTCWGVLRR